MRLNCDWFTSDNCGARAGAGSPEGQVGGGEQERKGREVGVLRGQESGEEMQNASFCHSLSVQKVI